MNYSEPAVGQPANGILELAFSLDTGQNTQKQYRNWNLTAVQSLLIIFSFCTESVTLFFFFWSLEISPGFGIVITRRKASPFVCVCVCVCLVVGVWAGDDVSSLQHLNFTYFLVLDRWDGALLPHDNQLINVPFMSFSFLVGFLLFIFKLAISWDYISNRQPDAKVLGSESALGNLI